MQRKDSNGGCFVVLLICLGLYACFHKAGDRTEAQQAALDGATSPSTVQAAVAAVTPNREFDEDAAEEAAKEELASASFEEEQGSDQCTDDCSGHEAGWQRARDDGEDCSSGTSESYDEGCAAYREAVEERVQRARDAFDQGDDAFEQ